MKIVNTRQLLSLVQHARQVGLNRLLPLDIEERLDSFGYHVLSQDWIHGDIQCIRCNVVMCKLKGIDDPFQGVLDFVIDDWNRIPEYRQPSIRE